MNTARSQIRLHLVRWHLIKVIMVRHLVTKLHNSTPKGTLKKVCLLFIHKKVSQWNEIVLWYKSYYEIAMVTVSTTMLSQWFSRWYYAYRVYGADIRKWKRPADFYLGSYLAIIFKLSLVVWALWLIGSNKCQIGEWKLWVPTACQCSDLSCRYSKRSVVW